MSANDVIDELRAERFLALDVELEPLGSPTFQVTTFANTGPSFYVDAAERLSVIVDSVASMANQLEATVWDQVTDAPAASIASLPWVEVVDAGGGRYTTSRTAAHRLNAHTMWQGTLEGGETFGAHVIHRLGEPAPPIAPPLAGVVWELDPLSLLQGIWLADAWKGRARLTRAVSARIDAHDVQTQSVQVGGQKTADSLSEVGVAQTRESNTVPGEIPHHTSEVSARSITARILLDVRLLRSYRLAEAAERALLACALLEIGEMLADWPRRRSRCALDVSAQHIRRGPGNWEALPGVDDLRALARDACRAACGEQDAEPLRVTAPAKKKAGS
jgi:CRISPR-associated protein Csb1